MKKFGAVLLLLILNVTTFADRLNSEINSGDIFSDPGKIKTSIHKLTRNNFEDSLQSLYHVIGLEKYGMSFDVFRYGMVGYYSLKHEGKLSEKPIVSIIDFTKKSTEKRFYTIDLDKHEVVFHSLVSHGKNTGENEAKAFSNIPQSNQSSLGFYVTGETYTGSKGYSLRLDGMDAGINDKMRERAVVMHDAEYVSDTWIKKYGRLGRSQGCPALPKGLARKVINTIKDKTVIFAYYNDDAFLAASNYLKVNTLFKNLDAVEDALAQIK
jgi:hypothetical protein